MSPRQKMINMMYLVLMALLALNVSKEILKSFHLFEQSFNNAAKNIDSKNTATMGALQKQMEKNPGKTKPYFERAQKAQKIADDFVSYMNGLKGTVEGLYGGAGFAPLALYPIRRLLVLGAVAGFVNHRETRLHESIRSRLKDQIVPSRCAIGVKPTVSPVIQIGTDYAAIIQ